MSDTRRSFLHTLSAVAAGITAATSSAQQPPPSGQRPPAAPPGPPPTPASEVQVPKMKFAGADVSRLVLGCNTFGGTSHFNATSGAMMRDYFTSDRVTSLMHQCNRFGINAYNSAGRVDDLLRFHAEGGKFHLIAQGGHNPIDQQLKAMLPLKPLAVYNMGEVVDRAFQTDTMDEVREWCKKARDLGVFVGVGTHKPEVIALVEEQGWDIDFYAGSVYNRTRTDEEWRGVLNGELPEMTREIYIKSDPPRMYKVMRQTKRPCFAFKILAAGRIPDAGVEQAFRTAFESLKPTDGVFVGMFPRLKDEVRVDAEIVHKILA